MLPGPKAAFAPTGLCVGSRPNGRKIRRQPVRIYEAIGIRCKKHLGRPGQPCGGLHGDTPRDAGIRLMLRQVTLDDL